MTTPTAPRARTRNFPPQAVVPEAPTGVAALIGKPKATKAQKDLAISFFSENKEMNRLKSSSEKTRAALYQSMKDAGLNEFEATIPSVKEGEATTALTVSVSTPTGTALDPAALYKIMGCATDPKALKTFLAIVSVTKAAVTEALGGAVATRIETPTTGKENVNVKPKK